EVTLARRTRGVLPRGEPIRHLLAEHIEPTTHCGGVGEVQRRHVQGNGLGQEGRLLALRGLVVYVGHVETSLSSWFRRPPGRAGDSPGGVLWGVYRPAICARDRPAVPS